MDLSTVPATQAGLRPSHRKLTHRVRWHGAAALAVGVIVLLARLAALAAPRSHARQG